MIRGRPAALIALMISIGAVMGQVTIGPSLNLTKTAKPDTTYSGENTTYIFWVNNTGNESITQINLTDTILGDIAGPFDLAPGENYTIMVNHTVYMDTLNNAKVEGFDLDGDRVNATASAFVDIIHPNLSFAKTVNPEMVYSGEAVNYTYFVNNTGDVDVFSINITDDSLGDIAGPFDLAQGENFTIKLHVIIGDDVLNNASVTGLDPLGGEVRRNSSAFVDVIHPSLSLNKTSNTTMIYSGDPVKYTYPVNNTGDVDLVKINLTDDALGEIAGPFDLLTGESMVIEITAHISVDTLNNATIRGIDPLGGEVNATSQVFVNVIHTELSLTKTVEPDTVSDGENVTYTFYLENTGDVNITQINITDDHLGHIHGPFDLEPGENQTVTMNITIHVATQNTATATGIDPLGNEVSGEDNADVVVITTSDIRSIGYWKHQFSDQGKKHIEQETLQTYLGLIIGQSTIFDETYPLSIQNATNYLWIRQASMLNRSVQQCLTCWLNWASGAVSLNEMVDTDWDGEPDTTFSDAMAIVEDLITNGEDKSDYETAKDICDSINNMGNDQEEGEQEEENEENGEESQGQGGGPPENKGEPQGRGPPSDKNPPVRRGPPQESPGRGPPEQANNSSNQKNKKPKK